MSYNESWFIFHNCRLKAVSRDKVVLNSNGTILHAAHNIQVQGKMFKRASGFKPWLIDTKIDVCRFVRNNYDPFAKMIYNLFKDFSNFNHTCPYVVNCNNYISRLLNISLNLFIGATDCKGILSEA